MQTQGNQIDVVKSNKLANLLENAKGFATVTFMKADRSIRKMNCRVGVKKHLKGGVSTLDPAKYVTVWDVANRGYRAINRNTIIDVKGV